MWKLLSDWLFSETQTIPLAFKWTERCRRNPQYIQHKLDSYRLDQPLPEQFMEEKRAEASW